MQHDIYHTAVRALTIASASALVTLGACSGDSNATGLGANGSSQLAFMAVPTGTASAALAPVTVGTHTLDLTKASITVSRAELKRANTDACDGDDDTEGNDDHPNTNSGRGPCGTLKIGPATVDLPLSGNVVTLPANSIPAGTYREVELRISQVELTGTFDGKAFDVTLPVVVTSEIEFSTPLVVTDTSATSVTVSVPVQTWLMNADGSLVDPSTIAASPTLSAQLAARIRASLRAFEDRDHDGHDDHDGRDGRGSGRNGGNSGPG